MADVSAPKGEFRNKSMDVPVNDLIPFCSCICFITSCYTEWPECFGCAGKRVCLMFYDEFLACKIPPEGDDKWFLCLKGYSYWAPVKVLCMVRYVIHFHIRNVLLKLIYLVLKESLAHVLRWKPLRLSLRRGYPYACHMLLLHGKRNDCRLLVHLPIMIMCVSFSFINSSCRCTSRKSLGLMFAARQLKRSAQYNETSIYL